MRRTVRSQRRTYGFSRPSDLWFGYIYNELELSRQGCAHADDMHMHM